MPSAIQAPQAAAIVIPLLRQVDGWLEQAVRSALEQTVACEVVVVTSPKTPPSNREILDRLHRQWSRLRVIEREPHMRFAAALNLGIRSTTADRIGILLTDDWLHPCAVERCLAPDADIVSTGLAMFTADGVTRLEKLSMRRTQAAFDAYTAQHERAEYLGHFLLFRRSILHAVGGVDESIGDSPGVDDFDMIWCMLDRGATVAIVEEALYNYRDHPGERLTTRKRDEMLATFNRILDKHGVTGRDRELLVEGHSHWFGKPIQTAYQELRPVEAASAIQPMQALYRRFVPLRVRKAIQARLSRLR